jgi:hypothetical protein
MLQFLHFFGNSMVEMRSLKMIEFYNFHSWHSIEYDKYQVTSVGNGYRDKR